MQCCVFYLLLATVTANSIIGQARAADDSPVKQFHALLDEMWEFDMREDPLFATATGDHRFNDELPKVSLADSRRRHAANEQFLERLQAIDPGQLAGADRTHYAVMRRQLQEGLDEYEFQSHLLPITHRSGFHIEFPELRQDVPLNTTADYENYIARLRAFGDYADGYMELMREGIAREKTLPAVIMKGYEPSVETHIVDDPTESLLYEPLKEMPDSIPAAEQERLRNADAPIDPRALGRYSSRKKSRNRR